MKLSGLLTRMVALTLGAGFIAASLPTEVMAASRTWTNASAGASGNKQKWGTTSQFATNWSGVVNPTAADTAVFAGNNGPSQGIATQSANVPIGSMTFSGTTAYSFTGQSVAVSGDGGAPNVGISNTSGKEQKFSSLNINSASVSAGSTGIGSLTMTALNLQGNYFAVSGDATVGGLTGYTSSVLIPTAVYEAKSGTQDITFVAGNNVTLKVNGATVSSAGDTNGTTLDIQGGSYVNGGTFLTASVTSGILDLSGSTLLSVLDTTGTTFLQGSGGITKMDIGTDFQGTTFSFVTTAAGAGFTLGGGLSLDGSGLPGTALAEGSVWNLFQGVNFTGGVLSAPNNASNFSSLALINASSSPYSGAFTQFGQEWIGSGVASNGTYLVFQAATGNLVVVPEPSTIVFAGLGVAMSGWTMWKKRRLSRLLAGKAS